MKKAEYQVLRLMQHARQSEQTDSPRRGHTFTHTRRINTEEKAKVVAAVWGEEFIQFLAALNVLH